MSLTTKIERSYPGAVIEYTGVVLWSGWELDEEFAIVLHEGRRFAVHTDHGGIYEPPTEFFIDKQEEAIRACKGYSKAVSLLLSASAEQSDKPQ